MKVAFDLDKTYEVSPHLFDGIALRFQAAGHQVGILTARNQSEGAQVSFKPDFVYFLNIGDLSYADRGIFKEEAMKVFNIDILFDDRANYLGKDVVALKII